jgi:Bacterial Ig-like domain (group 3)/MBG domain (YGX type)
VTGTALANYTLTKVNGTLTVTPVPLTVTANDATRPFASPNPPFTGTVIGAVLGDIFTVSGSTTALIDSPLGMYPITPTISGPALTSYTVTKMNGILTVIQASGSVSLAVSPNITVFGSQVTLTATVSSRQTGTVTFYDGTTALGRATISGTTATLMISTLAAGIHSITAAYNGDSNFAPSTSLPITLEVEIVILTPPPGPAEAGTPVTLTATVPAGATGTVTFDDGTNVLGTVTIPSTFVRTGVTTVTLVTTALGPGTHTITALFSGDANFPPSTSPPITVTITPPPADFSLASSTGAQLIPPGASANFTIHIPSVNSPFTNAVMLTASGLPVGANYTFSPATVTPGSAGADSTLTISVPKQSNTVASRGRRLGPTILALLLLPFAWLRRNRGRPQRLLVWMLMALASLGAVSGCGEGGYFSQTEQTYTITVTGTSGTVVRSTTVTLTVQ